MNPTINRQATGLQIFSNNETGVSIRTTVERGEIWFIAQDICNILGLKNPRKAMQSLEMDEKHDVTICYTPGGNQRVKAVNESGIYHLIFISRKPEAKVFRRWVTGEVLPSIRRTGSYSSGMNRPAGEPSRLPLPRHRPFFENWKGYVSPYLSYTECYKVAKELGISYSHVRKVFMGTSVSERVARALTSRAMENKRQGVKYEPKLPVYEQLSIEWEDEKIVSPQSCEGILSDKGVLSGKLLDRL